MVAKIVSGKSIRGMLHYNENKVTVGEAKLILSSGFAADINRMNFEQKLQRFEHLTMLNGKVKTNSIHISLNFDAGDKLSDKLLQRITIAYMDRIGFGDQPYLVYKHSDAAHPHLHITTTNIKPDGKRIDIHNIGRTLSEIARKELEKEFKLTQAEGRKSSNVLGIKAADSEKAFYGKTPTKRTITNIVNAVIRMYKFTSLAEMNAVLKQFNVIADRGKENTLMFQKNGLMFSITDEKGQPIGVPIKASSIYGKPTLKNLENKFMQSVERRKPYKAPLKDVIDGILAKYRSISKSTFISELQKLDIAVLFWANEQGRYYGSTFIDNRNKAVFNGSDLGKGYGAKGLTEQFGSTDELLKPDQKIYLKPSVQTNYLKKEQPKKTYFKPQEPSTYLKGLLDKTISGNISALPRKKKKKKKGTQPEQQQSI